MTREEALNKIHKHVGNGLTDAFRIVNKIFDEHEQDREDWIVQGDQLVAMHKHQCEAYEAQLKNLHVQYADAITSKKELVDDVFNLTEQLKAKNKLARKMCAMLFWEWRKKERRFIEEWNKNNKSIACAEFCVMSTHAEVVFGKAYAMLKATT